MATKLKNRNPVVTFVLFFLSLSIFLGTIVGSLLFLSYGQAAYVALDYKNTPSYRGFLVGSLAQNAVEQLLSPTFSEDVTTLFEQEGNNVSWALFDEQGELCAGNTNEPSVESFLQTYQDQLEISWRERSQTEYEFFNATSYSGYDHLLVIRGNWIQENINLQKSMQGREYFINQSPYAAWFSPTLRERLSSYPEGAGPAVCIAIRSDGLLINNTGEIYSAYYHWFRTMQVVLIVSLIAFCSLIGLLIVAIRHKSFAVACHTLARWSGYLVLEGKLVLLVVAVGLMAFGLDTLMWGREESIFFVFCSFWIVWLLLNDLRCNGRRVFFHNIPMLILRFLRSLDSRYAFCARMKRRLVVLIGTEALLLLLAVFITLALGWAGLLVGFFLLGFGVFLLVHYIVGYNRQVDELASVMDYTAQVRSGAATQPLMLPANSDFTRLADDLNDIHSGMARMVDARIKSDRMKAELITNVSHDLKTPLTSIINYVDLLSKEELSPSFANDYVKILAGKSERLKNLVQDLFEISKAQSGAIDFSPEQLNIVSLLEQTVAEMDARTAQAGNEIRLQFSQPLLLVCADGKKLHRVFENLLGNALKYSMPGTRVYVSMECSGQYVHITFKNVAGYEMNFTEQEIVERFQRGDASRTSEGSGLGLAIVKSFLELNGGNLRIELDGDLFKAIVTLPVYQPDAEVRPVYEPPHSQNPAATRPVETPVAPPLIYCPQRLVKQRQTNAVPPQEAESFSTQDQPQTTDSVEDLPVPEALRLTEEISASQQTQETVPLVWETQTEQQANEPLPPTEQTAPQMNKSLPPTEQIAPQTNELPPPTEQTAPQIAPDACSADAKKEG